jgi:hypothetical protein
MVISECLHEVLIVRQAIGFVILFSLFSGSTSAGFDELKAPIGPNTCRLANAYLMHGQDYSGSAGITINGQYPTAENRAACRKMCEQDESSRLASKPAMYGLRVACYFSNEKLFEREHR